MCSILLLSFSGAPLVWMVTELNSPESGSSVSLVTRTELKRPLSSSSSAVSSARSRSSLAYSRWNDAPPERRANTSKWMRLSSMEPRRLRAIRPESI